MLGRLALVALGVVFGFPLLSALALRELSAAHAPSSWACCRPATAVTAVLLASERPSGGFWLASAAGLAAAFAGGLHGGADSWLGFAYVSLVSMFVAFFAWYAALARGGVAKIGQIQLVQPLLTLAWAAALRGEHVGPGTLAASIAVVASS